MFIIIVLLQADSHPRSWEVPQRGSLSLPLRNLCSLDSYPWKNVGNHQEVPRLFWTYRFIFKPVEQHLLSHDADHRPSNKSTRSLCPTFPREVPCLVQNHGQCCGRQHSPANPTILDVLILWHIFFIIFETPPPPGPCMLCGQENGSLFQSQDMGCWVTVALTPCQPHC